MTQTVTLPWDTPPLTKNNVRRMHWQQEARARRPVVEAARWAVRAARLTPVDAANVVLHWRVPTRRRRDGDGADPTKAACIDALVLEGVLPDDSWAHIPHSGITVHPPAAGEPGALWLEVTEVSDGVDR